MEKVNLAEIKIDLNIDGEITASYIPHSLLQKETKNEMVKLTEELMEVIIKDLKKQDAELHKSQKAKGDLK